MSNQRDPVLVLIETVHEYLEGHVCEYELEVAYDAVMADPQLTQYATGDYDRISLNLPRGSQVTILGPDPV